MSTKLKDDKDHRLKMPLFISVETKLIAYNDETHRKAQVHVKLQGQEQHQLFVDLSHFLTLYLPKMLEN
jgi:hypothetical protein